MVSSKLPRGVVDTHVHSSPDVIPRLMSDSAVARAVDDAGYRAVVLKSHHTITAARATMAEEHTAEARIYGGVVLNYHATGGINPLAVETALKLGARTVWLPTITSSNQIRFGKHVGIKSQGLKALGTVEGPGIDVLDAEGGITADLAAVLDLIAQSDAALATGHISAAEIMVVAPEALRRGVRNVIVTHPELGCVGMSLADQVELAALGGVAFERVYGVTMPTSDHLPIETLAEAVRTVGVDTTIMATDFGQAHNPSPVVGLERYVEDMRGQGFTQDEVEAMTCVNPARALSLDEGP